MNNAIKNQIYPKKSQYITLDWLFDMMYETKDCHQDLYTHYHTS